MSKNMKATLQRYLNREFGLKFAGGGILLLSFITQNYFYDVWNTQSQDSHTAAVDQSLIDKSVLLNESLYFSSRTDDSINSEDLRQMKEFYIREAARKTALAKTVWILASALDKKHKVDLSNELMSRANAVKDFASFSDFNRWVNSFDKNYADAIQKELSDIERYRSRSRYVYLGLYVVGATLLALSLFVERKRMMLELS